MHTVNIGILAHVDAGKTSLTERLLYDTGAIAQLGSVDAGTTQTDTGDIERQRGITIRSAVAAFTVGDRLVNLIDTPGHSDFVAEVERALSVLDGAVLVLSAVEGVQPHTRLLMKILRARALPTLIFINKIDRAGARPAAVVDDIRRLLTPSVVPLGVVDAAGTPDAAVTAGSLLPLAPVLADHDDEVLGALVDDRCPTEAQLRSVLRASTARGVIHPVLFGSALTGAGIAALLDAMAELLPPSPAAERRLRAVVFAIERTSRGEKVAYVRGYGGELRPRQRVTAYRPGLDGQPEEHRGQVTALHLIDHLGDEPRLTAGRIAKVQGLDLRIGDQLGVPSLRSAVALGASASSPDRPELPRPGLETVARRRDGGHGGSLHAALLHLADEDPLIQVGVTAEGETSLLLYGEVQKEVIAATLADKYGLDVVFAPSQLMHLERPIGVGHAVEIIGHGFLGTVGLRVEPGQGVRFALEVEPGSLLPAFLKAVKESTHAALRQGVYGWPVTDITVTMTHSGYWARPNSAAGDFRLVTPHVLAQALAQARTRVFEPCHRFELEVPAGTLGPVTAHLARRSAEVHALVDGDTVWTITGQLPAREVAAARAGLLSLSNGEGLWTSVPHGDRAVAGAPPHRARTDGNPYDRVEYLRFLHTVADRPAHKSGSQDDSRLP